MAGVQGFSGCRELRVLPVDPPIEVEPWIRGGLGRAPRAFGHGHERDPRARRQRLLRAADRDVDAPVVEREGHGTQAGDDIDHDHGARVVRHPGEVLDGLDHAGGGLGLGEEHGLHAGMRRQRVRHLGGIELRSPRILRGVHREPVGLGESAPPVGEEPRERDEDLVTRREAVLDRGLEAARPAGRHQQDVGPVGPIQRPQAVRDVRHQLPEPGAAVVDERAALGEQHLGRDRGRSWRQDDLRPVHGSHSLVIASVRAEVSGYQRVSCACGRGAKPARLSPRMPG